MAWPTGLLFALCLISLALIWRPAQAGNTANLATSATPAPNQSARDAPKISSSLTSGAPTNATPKAPADLTAQPLEIGIFNYRPEHVLRPMWAPLGDYLERNLPGRTVRLHFLDQDEMATAVDNALLDIVFTNPAHYIRLRSSNLLTGAIATQVTLHAGLPVSQLGGVIIKRKDNNNIKAPQDLEGKTVAILGRQYLGGYTAQAAHLRKIGIDLGRIRFMGLGNPHDKVVAAVLDRRADAGFIRTGILEAMQAEGRTDVTQLEVIAPVKWPSFPFVTSTPLYPEWAVAALPHIDRDTSRRVLAALLAIEPGDPAAVAAGIYGFTIPRDYSVVEDAMVTLRLPPFDTAPEVTLGEFIQQNLALVSALSAVLVALALLTARLAWLHRQLLAAKGTAQQVNTRLQGIIDGTRAGTWEWNVETGETIFNERWAQIIGYSLAELAPTTIDTWLALAHPDDLPASQAALALHFAGDADHYDVVVRMRHKLGHWVWVHDRGRVLTRTPEGKPLWMLGTHIDDTRRILAEQERSALWQRLSELAENVPGALYQFRLGADGASQFTYASPQITDVYGYTYAQLSEDADIVYSRVHPDDYPQLMQSVETSAATLSTWTATYRYNHPAKGEIWVKGSSTPTRHDDGSITWHGYIQDITLLKHHEQELERMGFHDVLTGIPNRRLLVDRLHHAVAQTQRTHEAIAVCMLDLDGFKPVNDRYGHEAGDRLLIEIAHRLQTLVRAEDTVARLGGDEFTLILQRPGGTAIFDKVLEALRAPIALGQATVTVSASIGVAYFDGSEPVDADDLLKRADQALYAAKHNGRNGYATYEAGLAGVQSTTQNRSVRDH